MILLTTKEIHLALPLNFIPNVCMCVCVFSETRYFELEGNG